MNSILTGLSNFSCDMYKQLARGDKNLFFSPYSISSALSLAYAGAVGATADQMARVLHYGANKPLKILDEMVDLGSRLNTGDGKIKTDVANAAWVEQKLRLRGSYATLLSRVGDLVKRVDFINMYDAVRGEINKWVEDQTNNLIKDLIPDGVLDDLTRMVLVNAIYYKGKWMYEFDPNDTIDLDFTDLKGNKSKTEMMVHRKQEMFYMEDDRCQMALLPYGNGMVNMAVFLPNEQLGLERFEEDFDHNYYARALKNTCSQELRVFGLPKFKLESAMELRDELVEMGMDIPFFKNKEHIPDFSGVVADDEGESLMISNVIHKAVVEVNEEGTEAAATTAVVTRSLCCVVSTKSIDFVVNRPFMFAIIDLTNQAPLFMGRVTSL